MKAMTPLVLVFLLASAAIAQPPIAKLSGGPPSFLRDGLLKFMERVNTACEGSELESCKCLTNEEHTGMFQTVKEVQECKPTICKCADGSEISPALPEFLNKKSTKPFAVTLKEKFEQRAALIRGICDGNLPKECPCSEDDQEPIIPPFVTPEAVHKCNPSKCICENGDEVDLPQTQIRAKLTEQIEAVKALCKDETPETCTCGNNDKIDFQNLVRSAQSLLNCLPEICTCTDGTDVSVPTIEPPPFAQRMLQRLHEKITTICPGELPAQTCKCSNEKSGIDTLENVDDVKDIIRCRPNTCTCEDGSSVEIEQPEAPKFMKELVEKYADQLNSLCNGEMPTKCSCSGTDLDDIQGPFEGGLALFMCQVDECTCSNGDTLKPELPPLPTFDSVSTFVTKLMPQSILSGLVDSICPMEGSKIQECTCQDDSVVPAPFSPPKMIQCQPKQCKCQDQEGNQELIDMEDLTQNPLAPFKQLSKICNGAAPTSCQCSKDNKEISPPFSNFIEIALTCAPEVCLCEDQSTTKVEIPAFLKALVDRIKEGADPSGALERFQELCGGETPAKLTCQDESEVDMTLALPVIMFQCKPKMYQCTQDGEKLPLQLFGCENGK